MTPVSSGIFFNPSQWEDFSQDGEALQGSTVEKSSEVAKAVFSSPSQRREEGALSHSWDFTDYPFSPLDFPSEDLDSYEEDSQFLKDLVGEPAGNKRKGSPKESLQSKRSRFSELESSPKEDEISGFAQASVDCHEGFMQEELAQLEETVGLQESLGVNANEIHEKIGERSVPSDFQELIQKQVESSRRSETSWIEKQQIKGIKPFRREKFTYNEMLVLNAVREDFSLGHDGLYATLKAVRPDIAISPSDIRTILNRYGLITRAEREKAFFAGKFTFKILPSQAMPQELAPAPRKKKAVSGEKAVVIDSSMKEKVVELACKNYLLSYSKMEKLLREEGVDISARQVSEVLKEKGLDTPEKRKQAARAPQMQDQTLLHSFDLSDCAFSPSDIVLEDFSYYEQDSFSLENLDADIEEELILPEPLSTNVQLVRQRNSSGSLALVQQQMESSKLQKRSRLKKRNNEEVGVFHEEDFNDQEKVVLNVVHEDPFSGSKRLCRKLEREGIHITVNQISSVLERCDLGTLEKRKAAYEAGWPRFKTLSFPMKTMSQNLVFLRRERVVIDSVMKQKVVELACENHLLNYKKMEFLLRDQGINIFAQSVRKILKEKGLDTPEKRKQAALASNVSLNFPDDDIESFRNRPVSSSTNVLSEDVFVESRGDERERPESNDFHFPGVEDPENVMDPSSNQVAPLEISSFLEPLKDTEKSISQLDGFSQMVDSSEVLSASRGEMIGESSPLFLDSPERVNEKEKHEEIKERSIFSEPSGSVPPLRTKLVIATAGKERLMEFARKNPSMTYGEMAKQLKEQQGFLISVPAICQILRKNNLNTPQKRKEAALALQK
ncbi:MAG: hypothetical protein Q8L98_08015 [Chlamydiales bacterium]|nr:hypothetical protein [Chlamydiales bacterium]